MATAMLERGEKVSRGDIFITQKKGRTEMEAKNATEQVVLDYFERHASEDLKRRVDAEKKTIAGALHYNEFFNWVCPATVDGRRVALKRRRM